MMRLVPLLILAACSARQPTSGRPFVDTAGRSLRLPPKIERVVSLAPSTTEIVCALGDCKKLVGVDRFSNFPPEVASVPRVGNDTEPSVERIAGLRPDLVLGATTANSEATIRALERVGLAVLVCKDNKTQELFTNIANIGEALGRSNEAAVLVKQLKARLAAVHVGPARVKVLAVVWPEPLVVAGGGSLLSELMRLAGGENVAADSPQDFPTYSYERVMVRAPEVIIVGTHSDGAPPLAPIERLPLPAVRAHRVHLVDGDLLFRPGPRVVDAVELLAKLFHPTPDGGAP
jgi:iron complex transport system substrate-binding protein